MSVSDRRSLGAATMKRPLQYAAVTAVLLLALLLWRVNKPTADHRGTGDPTPAAQSKIENQKSRIPPVDATALADDLNTSAGVAADLRLVAAILETYRSNYLREGNPVGNNAEITAVLRGGNPLRLVFIPEGHPALNPEGELCDRWGTPYFFHAESAARMEIRSAGPDRKQFTADDAILAP